MAARRAASARRRASRISRRRELEIRRSSALRSRLVKGRRSLRCNAAIAFACSRATWFRLRRASNRASFLDKRVLPPRRELRAVRSRLEVRRFLALDFRDFSARDALAFLAAARFLPKTSCGNGRTKRRSNMRAKGRARGIRFDKVIRGSVPFLGLQPKATPYFPQRNCKIPRRVSSLQMQLLREDKTSPEKDPLVSSDPLVRYVEAGDIPIGGPWGH